MERNNGIVNLAANGAIVIINGEERDTYCAPYGTEIEWSVSKDGYEPQSGSFTLTEDRTIDVVLVPIVTNEPLVLTIDNSNGMQTPRVRRLEEDTQTFGTQNPTILACYGGNMDVEVNGVLYEDVLPEPTSGDGDYVLQGLKEGENVLKFYPKEDGEKFIFNYGGYTNTTHPNAHIVSIDDWGNSRFSSLYYAFYQLSMLKSVAKPSKSKTFADLTNAYAAFYGATGLESLPDGLFADAEKLENAAYLANKTSLKTLPNNLINLNAPVNLSYGFRGTLIKEVPTEWLKGSQLTNAYAMFYGCESLTTVGAGVFKDCTKCENIGFVFTVDAEVTSKLTKVGEGVFEGCESATNADSVFQYCSINTIPAKTFKGCKALSNVTDIFYDVTIKEIGESAFEGCESIKAFVQYNSINLNSVQTIGAYAFAGCKALTQIAAGFKNNTNLQSVGAYAFQECENMDFSEFFRSATSLETIGEGLFDGCANVTTFAGCFSGCTALTSIPTGLFANCTAVTTFESCFNDCQALTSIPTGLFDNNTAVTSFDSCFAKCIRLASIPENLFINCTKVTNFYACFGLDGTMSTALACESAYDKVEIDGVETIIHLYERENYPAIYTAPITTSLCYRYQTGLSDYDSIPSGWK